MSEVTDKSRRRTRRLSDERREELLRAGVELFSARSYDEVSIDEIAGAVGISRGLLYHYFPSKRDFYVAGLRRAADDLLKHDDARERRLAERTYLLEDCTSPVVVPGVVDYTEQADAAFQRYADAGMHVVRSTQPMSGWPELAPRAFS